MIKSFADRKTRDLFLTGELKQLPPDVRRRAIRKLEYIDLATGLYDLKVPPGNRLHRLKGNRKGQYSISVTINGVSVSDLKKVMPMTSRSAIIIEMEKKMSIANKNQRRIRPTHPGEMLREDFLPDFKLNASGLARAIGVSRQSINELLRCHRAVSPEMALRLGKLFGNSAEFWLNAQHAVDLWDAEKALRDDVASIKTLNVA